MGSAMELYAGFALLVIVIVALIVLLAVIANLWHAARRLLARPRHQRDSESAADGGRPTDWR
ncbi:MAG TPA: hypothetical protein VFB33_12415 [Candidatus Binataceae bacterium]|jgi:hypothetical protein|nr:hypothetical protein [Candidatus Binataceae bacterium]